MKRETNLKKNFIMNACLSASSIIFPIITFPYVSRILLPAGTGKVATATSVIAYFNMFAQLGIPSYGIKLCAQARNDREKLTRTVHELLTINLVTSFLAYIALAVALALVPKFRQERPLYILISFNIFLTAIGVEWMYKGLEQYTYITLRSIAFKLIGLAAMFLMIHQEKDYVIYGGITVIASSASYVLNIFNANRYIDLKPVGGYCWKRHLKPVAVFFAMACATIVYTHLDEVMLGFMKTDSDVGYYHAAVRIKALLVSLVTSLGAVLLPRASYYVEHERMDEFRRISQKALNFIFVAATPLTLYFIMFASPCIYLLSGKAFAGSILPMKLIMPTLLFIGLTNILGMQILVPTGREKYVLYSEIAGAVTDLILNAFLIPVLASAGAAIGTLVAEMVVLIVQFSALRKEVTPLFRKIHYGKIFLALTGGFVISVWLRGAAWGMMRGTWGYFLILLVSAVLFFSAYGALLLLLREPFTKEIVTQVVNRFRKGRPGKKNGSR